MKLHQTANCPYCKSPLSEMTEITQCGLCRTGHHRSCWKEYGRCSVFGCVSTRWFHNWNVLWMAPSLLLTASMVHPSAAFILSPFLFSAFMILMLEIFYFAYTLVEKTIVRSWMQEEIRKYLVYLFVNLIPIGLRFGLHLFVK
jgi:Prokaryotic RING finger family 1